MLEERLLDCKVEVTLRELLAIAGRPFTDKLIDILKRKRRTVEPAAAMRVGVEESDEEDEESC